MVMVTEQLGVWNWRCVARESGVDDLHAILYSQKTVLFSTDFVALGSTFNMDVNLKWKFNLTVITDL